jgi:hypothetical protein
MPWTPVTDYNMTTFQGVLDFIIDNSLGFFTTGLLIAVYIIFSFFYWLNSKDMIGSFAVGGLALFTVGLLLYIAGLLSTWSFILVLGIAIASWVALFIPRNK